MYKKSTGLNNSERVLAKLGEKSFLKLWSYPNLSRTPGTELCDLLVIFENNVLIFSDKSILFNKNKDLQLAWNRWKNKAINDSIKSVNGTQRWIKEHPDSIYLDHACTTPFPFDLNKSDLIFYKIIIANGAPKDLSFEYSLEPKPHREVPFNVSLEKNNIIHIFSDHNLSVILEELDTIVDFCDYFKEKEHIIQNCNKLAYPSETDLLAHYFMKIDDRTERHKIHFNKDANDNEIIKSCAWKEYSTSLQYRLKKEKDKVSYFWDEMLQHYATNILNNTMVFSNSAPFSGKNPLHIMAKEPRFSRRVLARNLQEAVRDFPAKLGMRHLRYFGDGNSNVLYVFLQLAPHSIGDLDKPGYRDLRQEMLIVACGVLKVKIDVEQDNRFQYIEKIIGIAIAPPKLSGRANSLDFTLLNFNDVDTAFYKDCIEKNKIHKFWTQAKLEESEVRDEKEFPDVTTENIAKFGDFDFILDENNGIIYLKKE